MSRGGCLFPVRNFEIYGQAVRKGEKVEGAVAHNKGTANASGLGRLERSWHLCKPAKDVGRDTGYREGVETQER